MAFQADSITDSAGTGAPSFPFGTKGQPVTLIRLDTPTGRGSTANNKVPRFANVTSTTGTAVTYLDDVANGATFTINTTGSYAIGWAGIYDAGTYQGISLNSSQLTTGVLTITQVSRLAMSQSGAADNASPVYWTGPLTAGDVIRPHDLGQADGTLQDRGWFFIAKIG